jgi:hypothetical protein
MFVRRSLATLALAASLVPLVACGEDETEYQQTIEFTAPLNLNGKFVGEPGQPSATDQTVPVGIGVDFDLAEITPALEAASEQGKLVELRLLQFSYQVLENTATTDLDGIEFAVAPIESTSTDVEGAVVVATGGPVAVGETPSADATLLYENTGAAQGLVYGLEFAVVQGTTVELKAGDPVPSGAVRLKGTFVLLLVAEE